MLMCKLVKYPNDIVIDEELSAYEVINSSDSIYNALGKLCSKLLTKPNVVYLGVRQTSRYYFSQKDNMKSTTVLVPHGGSLCIYPIIIKGKKYGYKIRTVSPTDIENPTTEFYIAYTPLINKLKGYIDSKAA